MASIDFCPLAKWVGEWRSEGRSWGGGSPVLHGAQRRKAGETPMIAKRGCAAAETVQPLRQGAGTGPESGSMTRRQRRLLFDRAGIPACQIQKHRKNLVRDPAAISRRGSSPEWDETACGFGRSGAEIKPCRRPPPAPCYPASLRTRTEYESATRSVL